MLYYLGGLIVSLEVSAMEVFLAVIIVFSIPTLIGLIIRHKYVMIIGGLALIAGTAGPIAELLAVLFEGTLNMSVLGVGIMIVAIPFHLYSIYLWYTQG